MSKIKVKVKWGMREEMMSLIVFLLDGNYENQKYAKERLMELADKIDEFNNQSEVNK
jgi:hypothetical protein